MCMHVCVNVYTHVNESEYTCVRAQSVCVHESVKMQKENSKKREKKVHD